MKVLLDTCISPHTSDQLKAAGHDAVWAGDFPDDPGDEAILAAAYNEGQTVITLDKDFGELAVFHGKRHCGIVRIVNFRAEQQPSVCLHILAGHSEELRSGAIITAAPQRIRIRYQSKPSE